ncbi:nucleoside diphosphate kinase, partial [Catenaria anguillulae PL171]
PSKALAEQHYADLRARPFYPGLVDYMTNGKAPVVAMVWQGVDVIRQGRKLIGATNPLDVHGIDPNLNHSSPTALRADFCISTGRNIIHGSDSYESANTEIALWFNESEIFDWFAGNFFNQFDSSSDSNAQSCCRLNRNQAIASWIVSAN